MKSAEIAIIVVLLIILFCALLLIVRIIQDICRRIKNLKRRHRQKKWERAERKWNRRDAKAQRQIYREYKAPEKSEPKKDPDKIFAESPDWEWDAKAQMWRHKKSE